MESVRVSTQFRLSSSIPQIMSEKANGRSIVSYVMRQSLPTISIVTADSLQDFKSASNIVVVGYFAPDDDVSYEAFKSVAEVMHEDFLFGVISDDTLAKAEQINVPGIVLYKNFDEGKNAFKGVTHNSQAITTFVKAAGTRLVVEFLPELHASYVAVGLDKHDPVVSTPNYDV
jgi:protein disulfide-isomerase A1